MEWLASAVPGMATGYEDQLMRSFTARRCIGKHCGSQVNLDTGGQVQTDLLGQVCEQHGKQRTHNVYDGKDGHYWQV